HQDCHLSFGQVQLCVLAPLSELLQDDAESLSPFNDEVSVPGLVFGSVLVHSYLQLIFIQLVSSGACGPPGEGSLFHTFRPLPVATTAHLSEQRWHIQTASAAVPLRSLGSLQLCGFFLSIQGILTPPTVRRNTFRRSGYSSDTAAIQSDAATAPRHSRRQSASGCDPASTARCLLSSCRTGSRIHTGAWACRIQTSAALQPIRQLVVINDQFCRGKRTQELSQILSRQHRRGVAVLVLEFDHHVSSIPPNLD